jgi:uridine phosphorylase
MLIRVGSCGSLQEKVKIGDLVIVTGALRGDGTSRYYVAENFSTVAHGEVVNALRQAADDLKLRYHLGWIFTTDALFQETPELIRQLSAQNVSSIDMVTSTFLTIAQMRGKKAGAVLAVSDECLHGKFGFRDPAFFEAEQKTIETACRALRYL